MTQLTIPAVWTASLAADTYLECPGVTTVSGHNYVGAWVGNASSATPSSVQIDGQELIYVFSVSLGVFRLHYYEKFNPAIGAGKVLRVKYAGTTANAMIAGSVFDSILGRRTQDSDSDTDTAAETSGLASKDIDVTLASSVIGDQIFSCAAIFDLLAAAEGLSTYSMSATPKDATLTDFGTDLSTASGGAYAWSALVDGGNGKVYGIPANAQHVLVYDKTSRTITLTDMGLDLSASGKWRGGVLAGDGKIYCIPYESDYFLIIDTADDTGELTDLGLSIASQTHKWSFGCLGPDGNVYGAPYFKGTFVKIVPGETPTASEISLGVSPGVGTTYIKIVVGPDGLIYGAPIHPSDIVVLDPDTSTVSFETFGLDFGSDDGKFADLIVGPDDLLYLLPSNYQDGVPILDVSDYSSVVEDFGLDFTAGNKFAAWTIRDGLLIAGPLDLGVFMIVDPTAVTARFTLFGLNKAEFFGTNGWAGSGVALPDGALLFASTAGDKLLLLGADTGLTSIDGSSLASTTADAAGLALALREAANDGEAAAFSATMEYDHYEGGDADTHDVTALVAAVALRSYTGDETIVDASVTDITAGSAKPQVYVVLPGTIKMVLHSRAYSRAEVLSA
jgi:hypothetical protein